MTTATAPARTTPFDWQRWPETDEWLDRVVEIALAGNPFAADLSGRMTRETGTRFNDWLDHLVLHEGSPSAEGLNSLGYVRQTVDHPRGGEVLHHPGGIFPRIMLVSGPTSSDVLDVAIKVESVVDFARAHDLGTEMILGQPLDRYRAVTVPGGRTRLVAVERRAYLGFEPFADQSKESPGSLEPGWSRTALLAGRDLWLGRKRRFAEDAEGFEHTEGLLARVIETVGSRDLACHLIFQVEREYWQSRNRAAQAQRARQDRLGLGWANHDHHTFRCSREFFPRVMAMFARLGFEFRESFHAGEHAGWGAQVLEHPTTGIVIFADLDLTADEAGRDFAHQSLAALGRPSTVGLWVALHGESILEAGMHHLEAQFSFDDLRDQLKSEAGIETMPPFSNFPFLRQAFTAGERWPVSRHRADRALARGWIDADQHARFLREGTIGSHLENLERREGYKGFNQHAVSLIIAATDPRLH